MTVMFFEKMAFFFNLVDKTANNQCQIEFFAARFNKKRLVLKQRPSCIIPIETKVFRSYHRLAVIF